MAHETTDAPRLDTGEEIEIKRAYTGSPHGEWEAVAHVETGAGPLDHHAVGDTPETAVARLRSYVARCREVHGHGR